MTTVWRIDRARYAATAFSGIGAQREGGHLNSVGTAVVCTAGSPAMVEVRVHVPTFRGTRGRVATEIDDNFGTVQEEDLPADWQTRPAPCSTQALGDAWVAAMRSAVLRVPSVVVPGHAAYVVNPARPDVSRIRVGSAVPLAINPRLGGATEPGRRQAATEPDKVDGPRPSCVRAPRGASGVGGGARSSAPGHVRDDSPGNGTQAGAWPGYLARLGYLGARRVQVAPRRHPRVVPSL